MGDHRQEMSTELDLGRLVWISVKPLIKISLPSLVGAALLKSGRIDSDGLKTAAKIQIYGALPCLMFANIVPSITQENSSSIGICLSFGVFYMITSYILAKIILIFLTVPDNFKSGFVVAAVWSNWGNLPISVIQSLTSEPPFGHPMDTVLGVAYASFFVLVHNITMFAGPGTTLIEQDFLNQSEMSRLAPHYNHRSSIRHRHSIMSAQSDYIQGAAPHDEDDISDVLSQDDLRETQAFLSNSRVETRQTDIKQKLIHFLHHLASPVSLALVVATVIAVIPPLKELFVVISNRRSTAPTAPDGKPIFSVVIDSAEYLGASAIPLALIVTGASFASMSVPRHSWTSLPIRAIFGLAFLKLIALPIIGFVAVGTIDKLTNIFTGKEARVLKMICLYYSCAVTSTNQISLSALAASDLKSESNVDLLCAFIIVQYLLYPVMGTIVIATGLKMIV